MSESAEALGARIEERFQAAVSRVRSTCGELTFEVSHEQLIDTCRALRDEEAFGFELLMDVCGVDYLDYGREEWTTDSATASGFSRGVAPEASARDEPGTEPDRPRFAAVYHLLSLANNHRVRLRAFCEGEESPILPSVTEIWASANWFEREAFDLFGILFDGHPDLRRILTDYGFIGHPFRKDFPLTGHVEVRYDPERGRVVYQPVSIEPRTLVPKVIRDDNRYDTALKDPSPDA